MRNFTPILILLLIFFSFTAAMAQEEDDPIKVESSVVRLHVGVADRQGRPIKNLNKENFTVYEDGVKQEISRFEPTVAPFSVVMLLDMSGSTKSMRQNIQFAAIRFIDALDPADRVAIYQFNKKVEPLNDFTNNRKAILNSIRVAEGAGDTHLYEALAAAIEKLGKEQNRRKAIVVLTDGKDTPLERQERLQLNTVTSDELVLSTIKADQNETLNQILGQADRLGVTIYPLALPSGDPKRLADPTPRQFAMYNAARTRLQVLAERTGGTLNAINNLEDMGRLYGEVAAELRALYTIEYQPTKTIRDGKWRAIKVEVDKPELFSKTRTGYFAK